MIKTSIAVDTDYKDDIMVKDKQRVIEKALKMSNAKPFIQYSQTHFHEMSELVNPDKPVQVYKNLHKDCWSVRQDGLVKCHTDYITLKSVSFKVGQKGRERVLREKSKNVHAVVEGYLASPFDINQWEKENSRPFSWSTVSYNPYRWNSFVDRDNGDKPVNGAMYCDMMSGDTNPVIAIGLNVG